MTSVITATVTIDTEAVRRAGLSFAGALDFELAALRRTLHREWARDCGKVDSLVVNQEVPHDSSRPLT